MAQDLVLAANVSLNGEWRDRPRHADLYRRAHDDFGGEYRRGVSIGTALSSTLTAVTKIGSATGIAAIIGAVISVAG